jgi:hypothetical protein
MKKILGGYTNWVRSILGIPEDQIEREAKRRLEICYECPFREDSKCGACGCQLQAKARSKSSTCPKDKW